MVREGGYSITWTINAFALGGVEAYLLLDSIAFYGVVVFLRTGYKASHGVFVALHPAYLGETLHWSVFGIEHLQLCYIH